MTRGTALTLAFGLTVLCANQAFAADADPLGPLRGAESKLLKGWQGRDSGRWFVLQNDAEKESEQTLMLKPGVAGSAGRYLGASVAVDSKTPSASIGLLARNTSTGDLCLMEITAVADANLFCVVKGSNIKIASQQKVAKLGGNDFLQLVESSDGATFFLNGKQFGSVEPSTLAIDQVGVMAYNTGMFGVGDVKTMTLAQAKQAASQASSGGSSGGAQGGGAQAGGSQQGGGAQQGGGGAGRGKPAGDPPGVALNPMEQKFDGVGPIPQFDGTTIRRVAAYLGIAQSVFIHEFGHALINELDLPSTGPEEDAVDIYSALHLVDPTIYKADSADIDAIGRETAIYGALQWYYSGKINEAKGNGETPWQDEHTADLKRFRNFFCVIYGGNPKVFGNIAKGTGIDDRTLSRCTEEYTKQNRAWRTILAPYTRVGPWHPEGTLPANAPGAKITVRFEPSKYRVGNFFRAAFEEGLRGSVEDLAKTYALPRPLTVVYRDCDQLNAWYSRQDASITMCYNLLGYLVNMVSDIEMKTVDGWVVPQKTGAPGGGASNAGASNTGGSNTRAGDDANAAPSRSPSASAGSVDEAKDFGVPAGLVLYPAPYKGPTPTRNLRAQVVTTAELASFLKSSDDVLLIDTSKLDQTIPGAIQVPDAGRDGSLTDSFQDQLLEWLGSKTKGDKKLPVVFFGTGINDRSSYNAALRTGAGGYKAYWYRGGQEAWAAAGLPLNKVGR
ncbi:hypothetical protein ASB57_26875 [Bordetella sp. N]|nr:hypothetical protein ASB57_26875 [Bordetella sp. N]